MELSERNKLIARAGYLWKVEKYNIISALKKAETENEYKEDALKEWGIEGEMK